MLKINKQTITLTKGDDASLRLVPRYKDKTEYVLTEGDSAVFRIKFGHTLVELECTLNLETNKIVANITPNDTKDFTPGIYRYEAELITSFGFHYTFIADQTFILGQEYEQRITSTSNGNSSAVGGNLPEIDGIVDGEPVVYGDIQPTNPMMDYEELNHLPKLNGKTIKGDKDNEYYGIPTKTSDLENDSDFVSDDDYVHTDNNYDDTAKNAVDALGTASTYDVPESGNASTSQVVKGDDSRLRDNRDPNPHTHSKADITDFPTNVSAFNNDSGFITNAVNNLANYYLKSETYTRAEVEQLIAAIKQGKFEIVAELPASGDANVIYLVPKSTAQTSNSYDEYVYINNAWEKIGDTDIDLSGYVTDDELTTALQSYLTTSAFNTAIASYYTKTETDNQLANKVDKVAGKGLSTNDYDNTAKGIVDGVTSALNDKVDKVQGKGLSTNDYDNTAKGIVDGVTSALADKVDKVNGKGLSTEDYTTAEKSKLGDISDNAKKVASSSTNGHIEIDDVDTTVYDDTAVQTAIDNIEDELSTDYATVEGNPINFSTKSAQNAKSTILSLEPIQDLHGYSNPWVGGAGKNKLQIVTSGSEEVSGVTFTYNSDGSVLVNGKATAQITKNLYTSFDFGNEAYILNGCPSGGSASTYGIGLSAVGVVDTGSGASIPTSYGEKNIYIRVAEGYTCNNLLFKPMVRLSTETDATFAPYKNICPISGRTEIGILGCGANLISNVIAGKVWKGSDGTKIDRYDYFCTDKIEIEGSESYEIRIGTLYNTRNESAILFWDANDNYLSSSIILITSNIQKVVVPNNAKYCAIDIGEFSNTSTPLYQYAQLEKISTDLTISLGQTVYGGTLDVENGVLVVDRKCKTLTGSDRPTAKSSTYQGSIIYNKSASIFSDADFSKFIKTNLLEFVGYESTLNYKYGTCIVYNETSFNFWIKDGAFADDTEVANLLDSLGLQVCYYLATPITINLTPHTIKLLEGINNISVDGDKITLTYRNGSVATLADLLDLEKKLTDEEPYGFIEHMSILDPAQRIEYIGKNKNYKPMTINLAGDHLANYNEWYDFPVIKENKPYMIKADGTVDYALDPNDYTKKFDGSDSDVANTSYTGGAFAWIPKTYKREFVVGNDRYVYISTKKLSDEYEAIGFIDENGLEHDGAWIPMFYGTEITQDGTVKIMSLATGVPTQNRNTDTQKTYLTNANPDTLFFGGAIVKVLTDIMIMLGKNSDIQAVFGTGNMNGGNGAQYMKNNACIDGGAFYGTTVNNVLNKAFHSLVLLTQNQWQKDPYALNIQGEYVVSPYYKYDLTGDSYVKTGVFVTPPSSNNWVYPHKSVSVPHWGAIPVGPYSGSTTTGWADGQYTLANQLTDTTVRIVLRFGHCYHGRTGGVRCVDLDHAASDTYWAVGASPLLLSKGTNVR